ncbi:hypothetical protein JYP52_23380 [Nitratireductor aquibiodomus]|uniref:EH signature domain-containing protein n=1 Tax=Nitratireductor aquibiodomus TaxID=204799 RepID=UPI0019D3CD85|nr:EH signature domain-containing protein [Nitratireductor aquibiodomus]MBN7764083.1 hypothetical protein [Nitratireductor aquibiodomus]
MRGSLIFEKPVELFSRALPPLDAIGKAVERISRRWPDAITVPAEKDREQLAMEMLVRVRNWSWNDLRLSRVMSAAMAVFDEERRSRDELTEVREFYLRELAETDSLTFLKGMLQVYLETFEPDSAATDKLAEALERRRTDVAAVCSKMLELVPRLFEPTQAPHELAKIMLEAADPYQTVKELGFRSPHSTGLAQSAYRSFIEQLGPKLRQPPSWKRLFAWLFPESGSPLQQEAGLAVEALLRAWGDELPPDDIRSEMSEAIIAAYNDPRTHNGGIWTGFDLGLKAILLRWLTKQDMLFFCDMVTATQNSHMWPPRREFWLRLYEQGRISEAWVAFGSDAREYARKILLRSGAKNVHRRFGYQYDRGGSTSLLIMRIDNKIVVDGCHSYKTHIFTADDPNAPKLYQGHYYCDDIMRSSYKSKPHNSIQSWADWVERNV